MVRADPVTPVIVLQMLARDGFDISRHPASMLSNGNRCQDEPDGRPNRELVTERSA